jgi:type IV pilus assembly protein PilV
MIQPQHTQRGTTLVEVLIAAVIIGVGLLGIASLQVKALQASTNAESRAKATDVAWALAARMRSNPRPRDFSGNNGYVSAAITGSCPSAPTRCAMTPDETDTAGVTQCTHAQMAAFDLFEARCATNTGVKTVLPSGNLAVTCTDRDTTNADPCDPGSQMTITVAWSTRDTTTGFTTDSISMTVNPGVDPMRVRDMQ